MNVKEALDQLYSLQKFGVKLGLENITALLEKLGNPQHSFRSFHVAGTNGKGSTASFISSMLIEAGNKTGLYTSPHFVKFNERVRINGCEIADDYIARFISDIWPYVEENKPTFFEVTTALAFRYFADQEVDYAVIETGLGGRLDATNVLSPLASIITSISLEHTEILGDTLAKIAYEKGGIIKPDSKVFIGRLPGEAEKVIEDIAREKKSLIFKVKDYVKETASGVSFTASNFTIDSINPPLIGEYQNYNCALAILTLTETLGFFQADYIRQGIRNVLTNSGLKGRFQIYSREPLVIFDSAHNIEGVRNFVASFSKQVNCRGKKVLLFGVMKDKAIDEMIAGLSGHFDEFNITSIDYQRAATINELSAKAEKLHVKAGVVEDGADFVKSFLAGSKDDCLVVLGSMYVLGTIMGDLQHTKGVKSIV